MKKIISLTVCIMFSVFTFAQQAVPAKKTPGQRADEITARIDKQLSLNAKQRMDVHHLAFKKEQKMERLTIQKGMRKELMDQERKKANEEFREGMKKVLTPAQYEKWMSAKRIIHPKKGMKMRREHMSK